MKKTVSRPAVVTRTTDHRVRRTSKISDQGRSRPTYICRRLTPTSFTATVEFRIITGVEIAIPIAQAIGYSGLHLANTVTRTVSAIVDPTNTSPNTTGPP